MVVDLFDSVGIPEDLGHLGIALFVLLAGILFLEQVGLHQADRGGARRRIEDVLEVPDDIVGHEGTAVVPFDVIAKLQGPGLEIIRGFPALEQDRPRDRILGRAGERFARLRGDHRGLRPVVGVRVNDFLHANADLQAPALGHCRPRRGREPLARYPTDKGIGGCR